MSRNKNLKAKFALNVSTYNKFYVNLAFKGLFWLQSDSSIVVLILNEYLNIYCIIISLIDSFGALTRIKKSLPTKTKSF